MSVLDEKTKAERALKDLQRTQGDQQVLFDFHVKNHHSANLSIFFFFFHKYLFGIFCYLHAFYRLLFCAYFGLHGMYEPAETLFVI